MANDEAPLSDRDRADLDMLAAGDAMEVHRPAINVVTTVPVAIIASIGAVDGLRPLPPFSGGELVGQYMDVRAAFESRTFNWSEVPDLIFSFFVAENFLGDPVASKLFVWRQKPAA